MKYYSKLLLVFVLFGLFSGQVLAASFPDVAENDEHYAAIEFLKERGIINGYVDGTFGPDNNVNRAEALKIFIEGFELEKDLSISATFSDVDSSAWFYDYVLAGKNAGLVNGYEDGSFKPGNTINLAEALKIMLLAAGVEPTYTGTDGIFTDVSSGLWYSPYAYFAREKNLLLADDNGQVGIGSEMNRADFAELIYRMILVNQNGSKPFALQTNWDVYNGKTVPFKIKYDALTWDVIENFGEVVFLKPDSGLSQYSPTRLFPNSAKVVVSLDPNDGNLSASNYFTNLRTAFAGADFTEFKLGEYQSIEVLRPEMRQVDWYIYLDTDDVLAVYTEYGDGVLGFQFPKVIGAMLASLEYRYINPEAGNKEQILSNIFENLLIEDKGMQLLGTLPDKLIIETDTIGVGTGAVDYYYSETLDYTFKYERSADLILDTREGRTSAF